MSYSWPVLPAQALEAIIATGCRAESITAARTYPHSAEREPDSAMAAAEAFLGLPGEGQLVESAADETAAYDTGSPAAFLAAAGKDANWAAPDATTTAAERRADGHVEALPRRGIAGHGYNLVQVVRGWREGGRGTAAGERGGVARWAQLDFARCAQRRGARASWREAVVTGRSLRGARCCDLIGCVS